MATTQNKTHHTDEEHPAHELGGAQRDNAEERFVALMRQDRMRSFVGGMADAPDDELRAAFGLAMLALREAAREPAAARREPTAVLKSPRAAAEAETLRLLSMQLAEAYDATEDETPALRPRKRPVGH